MIFKDPKKNENDDRDDADGHDLAVEVGLRAFLHRRGNLAHPLVSGRETLDHPNQNKSGDQSNGGANHRQLHAGIEKVEGKKHHGIGR